MSEYSFYMMRYMEEGSTWVDIESSFEGLRYKSCSGLNSYGEIMSNYVETFAETSKAEVYVSPAVSRKQTTIALSLLFLEGEGEDESAKNDESYHRFVSFISGCRIAYRDTARKRKVLMYLTSASEPTSDAIKGIKYKEVTFTFTNIYGESFGYDDDFPS